MANGHGGRRPNQTGRPRGLPGASKKTQMAIRRWANTLNPELHPILPAIEVMRDNLGYWHSNAREDAMKMRAYFEERGASPEQLLKLVAHYHNARGRSQEVARDLIQYEESKKTVLTIKTLNLMEVDDEELVSALLSMGVDVDALYREVVEGTAVPETVE